MLRKGPVRVWRRLLAVVPLGLMAAACGETEQPVPAGAASHAVILLYHHVAADTPGSTSVTPQVFERHLDHLDAHGYEVVPLSRIIEAVDGGAPLPERAVAITFDDAYRSVHREAAPRLVARGHPFSVFVATDYIDQGLRPYMSWDELRELEAGGAEIANHSRAHEHYVFRPPDESRAEWRTRVRRDIEAAQQRLEAELDDPLRALAYPYGEFDRHVIGIAEALDLPAFGQQSGPAGTASDRYALPRFPMAASHAALEAFAEKLRTRPFHASVEAPRDAVLAADAPAPTLRLRLRAPEARLDGLSCFVTGQGRPDVSWVERDAGLVEITARAPLPAGRSKYTCTAPHRELGGVFYWYSHLWMKPPAPGTWYRD